MALAAARWRLWLWRGMGTAAAAGTSVAPGPDVTLLSRLVSGPECEVKATMEEASSSAPRRDCAVWESLAADLLRASCPAKANLVLEWKLEKLLKEGIQDCKPYSTIIRFCGETRNAALAMRVIECVEAQGIQLNTGIFNALVNTFLSVGDLLSATTLYEYMDGMENCKPDSTTYGSFISAFSLLGNSHAMTNWYVAAKNAGFTPSTQTFESLITGFVRLNMLDDAETMFEEMTSFEVKPNHTILEAKLEMLCRRKEANMVRDFVKSASAGRWVLNDATVERLTRTLLDGGNVAEMEELLDLIQKEGHLSSETQLHCGIIKSYAKADRLADMEHAIRRMLDNGLMFIHPEDIEAVICCYFRHKDFDRLDIVLNYIQSPFKLARSTYDILVAGYRRFGLHERLDSTMKDMKKAGFG